MACSGNKALHIGGSAIYNKGYGVRVGYLKIEKLESDLET
jgi:hypothetical protein